MFQTRFERLLAFAEQRNSADLIAAKEDFEQRVGRIFEEDEFYEQWVQIYQEWFAFDRPSPDNGKSVIALFLDDQGESLEPENREFFEAMGRTMHSVFEVRKINLRKSVIVLRSLLLSFSESFLAPLCVLVSSC